MMTRLEHAWGESFQLVGGFEAALFRFRGKKGGASSLHLHEHKVNVFIVSEGILEIEYDGLSQRLYPGKTLAIPAGTPHRMTFLTDAAGYELYYAVDEVGVVLGDIKRLQPGWTPEGEEYRKWQA
jgi:quercetin dioxygenase-like cupin family protein